MALRSLGSVTAASGTPVRLTLNETDPTARFGAHSFLVEARQANTAKVYIGTSTMNRTTLAGVFAVIPIPTLSGGVATILPSFSATITYAPQGFNLADIWLDTDVSGEGCLVSCIRA